MSDIAKKLDQLDEKLDRVEITLVKNTQILDEHQRRSAANEAHVAKLEEVIRIELIPTISLVKTSFRIFIWIGAALGGIAAFILTLKQLNVF